MNTSIYSMRADETLGEYMARTAAEKAASEQAEAQQQAQAAASQPAPQPADEREAIISKYVQAAQKEINERAQLTQTQRDYEGLTMRQNQLGAEFTELSRNATFNAPRLDELAKEMAEVEARRLVLHKELNPSDGLTDAYMHSHGAFRINE